MKSRPCASLRYRFAQLNAQQKLSRYWFLLNKIGEERNFVKFIDLSTTISMKRSRRELSIEMVTDLQIWPDYGHPFLLSYHGNLKQGFDFFRVTRAQIPQVLHLPNALHRRRIKLFEDHSYGLIELPNRNFPKYNTHKSFRSALATTSGAQYSTCRYRLPNSNNAPTNYLKQMKNEINGCQGNAVRSTSIPQKSAACTVISK